MVGVQARIICSAWRNSTPELKAKLPPLSTIKNPNDDIIIIHNILGDCPVIYVVGRSDLLPLLSYITKVLRTTKRPHEKIAILHHPSALDSSALGSIGWWTLSTAPTKSQKAGRARG